MAKVTEAGDVTLGQLEDEFGLQRTHAIDFFPEWQGGVLLTELEREYLNRVRANFEAQLKEPPLLEDGVKMVVLSPLLDLAGFYQQPFKIQTEASIEISAEDGGTIVRGRIDILVLLDRLWLLAIESKRSDFAVTRALPQALAYMRAQPTGRSASFGLIANGNEFLFVKLDLASGQYGLSRLFSLVNPGNELVEVLGVLREMGARDGAA
ncbi:MAG: type I restriction endonuclease [Geitlerinemataceae cyanobacterium]